MSLGCEDKARNVERQVIFISEEKIEVPKGTQGERRETETEMRGIKTRERI